LRDGLGKAGAYRDEEGVLHGVSLRCTHLGCLLRFNGAERSWDCPCHGSRFDIDGAVLEGPAVHPLEQRDLNDRSRSREPRDEVSRDQDHQQEPAADPPPEDAAA
jgi:Rieske Fe-S protein